MQKYLTNLSNSKSGVESIIRAQERQHWLRGLRQAELVILEKEGALLHGQIALAKQERQRVLSLEILATLTPVTKKVGFVPIFGQWLSGRIKDIHESLQQLEASYSKQEAMVRDCQQELKAAQDEWHRIVGEHPEILDLSSEEIEDRYGQAVLLEKKLAYIVPRAWAAEYGLPESVGVALYEATPNERQYLLARIFEEKAELTAAQI